MLLIYLVYSNPAIMIRSYPKFFFQKNDGVKLKPYLCYTSLNKVERNILAI